MMTDNNDHRHHQAFYTKKIVRKGFNKKIESTFKVRTKWTKKKKNKPYHPAGESDSTRRFHRSDPLFLSA